MAHRLTSRQRQFVAAYLGPAKGNASEAARLAGYGTGAGQHAHRLLKNAEIRAAIDAGLNETSLTSNQILANLSEIADGSLEDYVKVSTRGNVSLDLAKAKKAEKLRLIRKLKIDRFGQVQIELHDPLRALELLGKYRGIFKADAEIAPAPETIAPHAIPDADPRELASDGHPPLEGDPDPDAPV